MWNFSNGFESNLGMFCILRCKKELCFENLLDAVSGEKKTTQ